MSVPVVVSAQQGTQAPGAPPALVKYTQELPCTRNTLQSCTAGELKWSLNTFRSLKLTRKCQVHAKRRAV